MNGGTDTERAGHRQAIQDVLDILKRDLPAVDGRARCDHCKGRRVVWHETMGAERAILIRVCEYCKGHGKSARRYTNGWSPRYDRNPSHWSRVRDQIDLWLRTVRNH